MTLPPRKGDRKQPNRSTSKFAAWASRVLHIQCPFQTKYQLISDKMGCVNDCQQNESQFSNSTTLNGSIPKVVVTYPPKGRSVILEQESNLEESSQQSQFRDKLSKDVSDDLSNTNDFRNYQVSRVTFVKLDSYIQLFNLVSQQYLKATAIKHPNIKRAYEVTAVRLPDDYAEWKLEGEISDGLQNRDIVKILHCLTHHRLAAFNTPIDQDSLTVAAIQDKTTLQPVDCWKIETVNQDQILRVGSLVRIVHVLTQQHLCYTRRRNKYSIVLKADPDNTTIWRIDQSDI